MGEIKLYRKRLIPYENVRLDNDLILLADKDKIITSWKTLHPRKDIDHGYSLYLLKEGVKISKFLNSDNEVVKWYCDIVEYQYNKEENSYTALDLLLDITINPSGDVKVLDMDELAAAHKDNLLDDELLEAALTRANKLLGTIYSGNFVKYQKMLNSIE